MEEVEGEQHAGWMLGGERTTYTGLFYVRKHARTKLFFFSKITFQELLI